MASRILRWSLVALLIGFAGCSGCGDDTSAGGSGSAAGGDVLGGDGYGADGGSGSAATDAGSGSATADGGTGGDGGDTGGSSQCPGTKVLCDGNCVATRLDPDHCGSCGNTCSGDSVCNAGQCVDSCPLGMEKCGNECVDLGTSQDHCGECGTSCPSDRACNNGECTKVVDVGPGPDKCNNGGPNIDIGFGSGGTRKTCSGRVAKTTFRWALCSCDAIELGNTLRTDAYDSSKGPYTPGGFGGGVGTNGRFQAGNKFWIFGALWTSSSQGINAGNEAEIKLQLHSEGPVNFQNTTNVRGDAYIGDDLTSGGEVTFHKTLYLPSSAQIEGQVQTNNVVRQPVSVSPVCKRCQPGNGIPVRQIVARHESNNDNQAVGLDPGALDQPGGKNVLKLPCGAYYLDTIDVGNETTIVTTGHTALYIGGDVEAGNQLIVKPTPGSTLDVFVAGNVNLGNTVEIGSPAYPANTRFYVGGSEGWTLGNKAQVGANVYALPGGIHAGNEIDHFGGLYAQNIDAGNKIRIHYDREVLDAGEECPGGDGDGTTGGDAGYDADGGGGSGGVDADGGGDDGGASGGSTCSDKDDSCSSDADCCAPLVCDDGTCQNTGCNNLFETCSTGSDCCSGNCAGGVCRSG